MSRIAGERVFMKVMADMLVSAGVVVTPESEEETVVVKDEQVENSNNNGSGAEKPYDDRPHILSNEAFKKRRENLEEALAEKKNGNAKPFKRLIAVVDWDVLHKVFLGRAENPVSVEEYLTYRDTALAKLPENFGDLQFTPRAHERVHYSFFKEQLRQKVFHGRFGVDLLEVEQAIVVFEQKERKRQDLEADSDELVVCYEKVGGGICVGEFLPKRWLNRNGNPRGNWNADKFDEKAVPVCSPCETFLMGKLVERNNAIVAACQTCQEQIRKKQDGYHNDHCQDSKNMTARLPRFLCKDDAEDVVERRMAAIRYQKEQADELERGRRESDESANRFVEQAVARSQYKPSLKRWESNKKGRSDRYNNDRRKRDRDY